MNNTPKKICLKLNEKFKERNNIHLLTYNQYLSAAANANNIENKRRFNNDTNGYQQNISYAIPNPLFISTPNEEKKSIRLTCNSSFYKIKQPSFEDDEDDDELHKIDINSQEDENDNVTHNADAVSSSSQNCVYNNYSDDFDESTQVNINAPPKLIESTFNSSSISNMSSDLIILQHVYQKQNQINMKDGSTKRYVNF